MRDAERFIDLLEPCRRRLAAISRGLIRRRADADDAVQEAVLKAWEDFPRYSEGRSFSAWVISYLVHTIRNRNRLLRHELEVPLPAEIEDPQTMLGRETAYESFFAGPEDLLEDLDERLAAAIRGLSGAERLVLLLRAVGELSYRDIAGALAIPEGTAMSHLSRARKRLRIQLSEGARSAGEGPEGGAR